MTGGLDCLDLCQQRAPLLILHPAQVDDHVDLRCPFVHSRLRLEALDGGGVVAVGEADDRADGETTLKVFRRLFHIAGRDADAGAAIADAVITDLLDLRPGGSLG